MQLTRRDAVAALSALGVTGGAAIAARRGATDTEHTATDGPADRLGEPAVRASMRAVAHVVYPSAVSGIDPFVDRFLDGRLDDSTHGVGVIDTVTRLDDTAREWHDGPLSDLSSATLDSFLREVGADTAAPAPDGTFAERVRYYVVNELLLAVYATPTGAELVGLENPRGHPGGIQSYQQGPQ